ncbi:MAG: cytosolic protein [Chloroflexi bacterium]|nr:MAG: cytosolic protein [Chloroflexota bacterium]
MPEEAWRAIAGAVDMHVHVAPDVIERRLSDLDLASEFLTHGLRGFVLKSHYVPTAERAAVVRQVRPGIEAVGSITLNHAVGGLNPAALEISARLGARVVWMPTVDAANEWTARPVNAPPPAWGAVQAELMARAGYPAPISLLDPAGQLTAPASECLELALAHGMVVATGHIGRAEVFALVERVQAGDGAVVVTHAEFPSLNLSAGEQLELTRRGAFIEHCFTTAHTGKTTWDTLISNIRATGPQQVVISTDLGQTTNPPVAAGLAEFAERLLAAGFSSAAVTRMAVTNPCQLLGIGIVQEV